MDEMNPKPRVSEALVPSQYRVYPDTPLTEVVDLMVRRSLHAVPVVGRRPLPARTTSAGRHGPVTS